MAGIPALSPYCLRHTFFTWMDRVESRRSIVMAVGGHTRERHADGYIHPEWGEHQKAINKLPVPTNFTTVPGSDQSSAGQQQDEVPGLQLFRMVGPCGLEPQTSTVSILWAVWEQMRLSEYNLHHCNALSPKSGAGGCKRLHRVCAT
jgi:hypothetical protein